MPLLLLNFAYMRTTVNAEKITIAFGALIPFYIRRISLTDIGSAVAVTYSPLQEFGGWGIRYSLRGGGALNMQGSSGLRLELNGGKRLLIGSQRSQELADVLTGLLSRLKS